MKALSGATTTLPKERPVSKEFRIFPPQGSVWEADRGGLLYLVREGEEAL